MSKLPCFLLLFAAACLADGHAQTAPSDPTAYKLGGAFDYSRGSYGFSSDTEVTSAAVLATAENHEWLLRLAVPYVTVKGPAAASGDLGPVFGTAPRPTAQSESGLGDLVLSGTWHANPDGNALRADLTGRVKFATADEGQGLGTGRNDYYAQLDLYQHFGAVTPFGTAGYRFLGHDAAYPLKDGPYATGGLVLRAGSAASVGAAFDWRSRLVRGGDDATDLTAFLVANPSGRWSGVLYVLSGFNEASPDLGLGGQLTCRF